MLYNVYGYNECYGYWELYAQVTIASEALHWCNEMQSWGQKSKVTREKIS